MKVISIHQKNALSSAVEIIKQGGIVFSPTDTIYGLLANALDREAVERLYSIRRPSGRPFIILLPDKEWLEAFDLYVDRKYWDLLDAHVTIIFYKKNTIPLYLTKGKKSLAFRIPKRGTFVRALLTLLDLPLVAPSANPEGLKPAVDVKMAEEYFGDKIDLYIDGGYVEGKPSTIVRFIGKRSFRLVREGNVKFEDFLNFAKNITA